MNSSPLKMGRAAKGKANAFQPSFFRCENVMFLSRKLSNTSTSNPRRKLLGHNNKVLTRLMAHPCQEASCAAICRNVQHQRPSTPHPHPDSQGGSDDDDDDEASQQHIRYCCLLIAVKSYQPTVLMWLDGSCGVDGLMVQKSQTTTDLYV